MILIVSIGEVAEQEVTTAIADLDLVMAAVSNVVVGAAIDLKTLEGDRSGECDEQERAGVGGP